VCAVALRLSDVAGYVARSRHVLRARPIDAASSVLHHVPILHVRHASAAQSVNPSLALIAFHRVLALRHLLEAHVPCARSCRNLHFPLSIVVVERKIFHDSCPCILGNTIWRCSRTRDSYSLCSESMSVGINCITDAHACFTVYRSRHNEPLMVL